MGVGRVGMGLGGGLERVRCWDDDDDDGGGDDDDDGGGGWLLRLCKMCFRAAYSLLILIGGDR